MFKTQDQCKERIANMHCCFIHFRVLSRVTSHLVIYLYPCCVLWLPLTPVCYEMTWTDARQESTRGPRSPSNPSSVYVAVVIFKIFIIVPGFAFLKGGTPRSPPYPALSESCVLVAQSSYLGTTPGCPTLRYRIETKADSDGQKGYLMLRSSL